MLFVYNYYKIKFHIVNSFFEINRIKNIYFLKRSLRHTPLIYGVCLNQKKQVVNHLLFCSSSLFFIDKNILNAHPKISGDPKRQYDRRVVPSILQRSNRLARHPKRRSQLFLPDPLLPAQLFQTILHTPIPKTIRSSFYPYMFS